MLSRIWMKACGCDDYFCYLRFGQRCVKHGWLGSGELSSVAPPHFQKQNRQNCPGKPGALSTVDSVFSMGISSSFCSVFCLFHGVPGETLNIWPNSRPFFCFPQGGVAFPNVGSPNVVHSFVIKRSDSEGGLWLFWGVSLCFEERLEECRSPISLTCGPLYLLSVFHGVLNGGVLIFS